MKSWEIFVIFPFWQVSSHEIKENVCFHMGESVTRKTPVGIIVVEVFLKDFLLLEVYSRSSDTQVSKRYDWFYIKYPVSLAVKLFN